MSTIRTFIAVETPPEIRHRAAALIERLQATSAKVRWVDLKSVHWTLNFLGDVPDREIADVCREVMAAAAPFTPFDLDVCGCGSFPSTGRPRTIWLGAGEGSEALGYLQMAITRHLATLGFRPEARRFDPHLTLGRVRDSSHGLDELAELIRRNSDFSAGPMVVDEVTIFSSELEREGPIYSPLGHAPLLGKPTD